MTSVHATDRIYIQSPSFLDLETVRTRSDKNRILARQRVEDPSAELESLLRSQSEEIGAALVVEKIARVKKLQQERERETDSDKEEETKASDNYEKLALEHQEFDETKAVEHKSSQWSYYSEPEEVIVTRKQKKVTPILSTFSKLTTNGSTKFAL